MEEKAKPDTGDITTGGSLMHSAPVIDKSKADFSGYVTKANLLCEDGRTILPDAFKDQDQTVVPLVWQHNHDEPENVLGHALLENREDGVYGWAFLNGTEKAVTAKELVEHKDISSFSIYANKLTEKAKKVLHGVIREVSLVLSGSNPGALIDNVVLAHGNGDMVTIEDEAVIYTGITFGRSEPSEEDPEVTHSADDPTVQDVYDAMDEDQKNVVAYFVGAALEDAAAKHSTGDPEHKASGSEENNEEKEGTVRMRRNVFEQQNGNQGGEEEKHVLTHDAMRGIIQNAEKMGSMKAAFEDYALQHGIENLDLLFPDAKAVTQTPEFDKRRTEWVAGVINGTKHLPFSRLKTRSADITHEDARAKGYIKGNLKKEEFFRLMQRVTTPKTIYKKQKLDRDDIIDITDMDVVGWMKGEMRLMLDEEIARAVLLGDGRAVDDEDKISDPEGAPAGEGIRSILHDDDLYAATVTVPSTVGSGNGQAAVVDELLKNMGFYKGSGSPTFFTTLPTLTWLLLARDGMGRRMYRTASDLAAELGVGSIVTVEVMEDYDNVVGIIVNLNDYSLGADRGGDVAFFDDFDIDYNQYKYLIETRLSGALTKIRSAIVVRKADAGDTEVVPAEPGFDGSDVTIVDQAGVVYRNAADNTVMNAAGSPYAVAPGDAITVSAEPDATHYFENNIEDEWTFENNG
jgi:hypothetical protein